MDLAAQSIVESK